MHCSRCILSWTNTLHIIALSSKLMRLNLYKSTMKTKVLVSSSLSLLILWFFTSFCTAVAQILSWPFPSFWRVSSLHPFLPILPLCFLASLSSWFLPRFLTPCPLPFLVLHALALSVEYIVHKAPGMDVCQLFVLLPVELQVTTICQWISPDESHLWSVVTNEYYHGLRAAVVFNKSPCMHT